MVAALALGLALVAAGCSSPSSSAARRPRIYAALGDSYASGEGLPPFEADSGACNRSPAAYPRLVAAQEGSVLDFAACTGATVADVAGPAGQLASVDPKSDLVTVTMGGNDVGFVEVLADCLLGSQPCSRLDADVEASLGRLGPTLETAYRTIRAKAPNARLVVVGYPQVVADPVANNLDACPALASPVPGRRITADEARWLREKGARLEGVVRAAAKAVGATYVDVAADFAGHEACTPVPWLTGVVLTDIRGSFHPTTDGQAELARLVTRVIGERTG